MILMSAPQYNNSGKYSTYMYIPIGHNLLPLFAVFLSPRGDHGRKKMVDFHLYGYETFIFTLCAPHEEA